MLLLNGIIFHLPIILLYLWLSEKYHFQEVIFKSTLFGCSVYLVCIFKMCNSCYHSPTKLQNGNVFTGVCHSDHRGSPCDHYPWGIGPHGTAPQSQLWTWPCPTPGMGPDCTGTPWPCTSSLDMVPHYTGTLIVTSGGYHWRPVQTYSFQDSGPSFPTSPDILRLLMHVWSAQPSGTHPTGKFSCFWSIYSRWVHQPRFWTPEVIRTISQIIIWPYDYDKSQKNN